ncbi:MAG TPA: hypothetical protein DCY13_06030 [Verrucomicrobiales bacterium]|nr:hypothetical protein [Verrucomicrobiales bacterium]
MKSKHVHVSVIAASLLVSALVWFNLRTRTAAREAELEQLRSELELARTATAEEAAKARQLEAKMNENVELLNRRLAEIIAEKERLAAESATPAPEVEAELPYRWDDASPTARVGKRFLKSMRVRPLMETNDGDFEVDPLLAAALSMTREEHQAANESLRAITRSYRELEREQLIVSDEVLDPDFKWMNDLNATLLLGFHVPAMPEAGARLRDRFTAELHGQLGSSRARMFMELGEEQFRSHFGSFGEADRWLFVAERIEPNRTDINLNVMEKTSNGHYYNVGMGIPREQLGKSGPGIPVSWRHLIDGHYVQGQSLGRSPAE